MLNRKPEGNHNLFHETFHDILFYKENAIASTVMCRTLTVDTNAFTLFRSGFSLAR